MVRIALMLLLLLAAPALALESAPVTSARATATLVSDTDAVQPGVPLHLALRLRLAPGWHTYWRNPGDAGVAPELVLNVPAGPIAWPVPQRQPEASVMTYGYTGEVLLPVAVVPDQAGALEVEAQASWLVCEKLCVPEEGVFRLSLPVGTPGPSAEAPLFAAGAARVPRPSPFAATVSPEGVLSVMGAGLSRSTVRDAWFFPEAEGIGQPSTAPEIGDGVVRIALRPEAEWKAGAGLSGVLVLRDPGGEESALQVAAVPGAGVARMGLWRSVVFAALGGLILNLMPCVFPVLAMKAVAVAGLSGRGRRAVRAEAVSYVAGVMAAFLALGGVLLGLRAAGSVAGWGFQFQSPMLVGGMAMVLFAVGLNLSGVFAVGGRLMGAGQGLAAQGGHAGSFFTGLLAVVVATPCTAPLMGAAIAAALAGPAVETLLVFGAMGVGLALPYGLLAVAPGLARALPRPGAWMDVLKGAMAFPMYGAAAWLLWVISLEAGPAGVLAVAAGLVSLGFGLWAWGMAQRSVRRWGRRSGFAAAVVAGLGALALLPGIATTPAVTVAQDAEAFTPARLAALRAAGRPVFVNMTAAWCVTCLVNERIALAPASVQAAFAAKHVAYLKGDWTRADPAISAFLRDYARDGVPLYVLYPANDGPPSVLPQILTEGEMLSRLNGV